MEDSPPSCHPLTLTRPLGTFPIGNRALSGHQAALAGADAFEIHPHAWICPTRWDAFLASGCKSLVAEEGGELLARGREASDDESAFAAPDCFLIQYPWDLLRANESHVAALRESRIEGEVHPLADLSGVVHLGPGSRLLAGVVIEGKVIIGANCMIGPNCYLRGHTSIGDQCHIGQSVEIKNSLILSRTNVGHLSYVGDSVLGEGVNFGAGTTVSNLRHDGLNHRSMVGDRLVDTGRRKFGTIIGDGVHTGIQTSIYPGRKMWPGTSTRPAEVVERDVVR